MSALNGGLSEADSLLHRLTGEFRLASKTVMPAVYSAHL
jgi:hypothetical protein